MWMFSLKFCVVFEKTFSKDKVLFFRPKVCQKWHKYLGFVIRKREKLKVSSQNCIFLFWNNISIGYSQCLLTKHIGIYDSVNPESSSVHALYLSYQVVVHCPTDSKDQRSLKIHDIPCHILLLLGWQILWMCNYIKWDIVGLKSFGFYLNF